MKNYIISTSVDYADEFYYPVISVFSEEIRNILIVHKSYLTDDMFEELYFGTNEFVTFKVSEIIEYIDKAQEISQEEIEVLTKYKMLDYNRINIIEEVLESLYDRVGEENPDLQKRLERLEVL
jgi:hypothetical protein